MNSATKPAIAKSPKIEQSTASAAKQSPTDKPLKNPASKDTAKKLTHTPEIAAEKYINTENASTFAKCIIKSKFCSEDQRGVAKNYLDAMSSNLSDQARDVATKKFLAWYGAPKQADLVKAIQANGIANLKSQSEKHGSKAIPETSTDDDIKTSKQSPKAKHETQSKA